MVTFSVGDILTLRASILDFCGTSNFLINHDINLSVYPNPCIINAAAPNGCLSLGGRVLEFQWTNASSSVEKSSCGVPSTLKVLGTAVTDAQGIATLQYTVNSDDLNKYNLNSSVFDLRVCIRDTNIITSNSSNVMSTYQTGSIIILQSNYTHTFEIGLRAYSWYTPQGAADWLITNLVELNGKIANFFSTITDWQYVKTDIVVDGDIVLIKIRMNSLAPLGVSPQVAPAIPWATLIVVTIGVFVLTVGIPILFSVYETVTNTLQQGKRYTPEEVVDLVDNDIITAQIIECKNNFLPSNPSGYVGCVKSTVCGAQNGLTDVLDLQKYNVDCTSLNTNADFDACMSQYNLDGNLTNLETCTTNAATKNNPKITDAAIQKQMEGCIVRMPFTDSCIIYDKDLLTVGLIGVVVAGGYLVYTNYMEKNRNTK